MVIDNVIYIIRKQDLFIQNGVYITNMINVKLIICLY